MKIIESGNRLLSRSITRSLRLCWLLLILLWTALPFALNGATVTTDQSDYSPFTLVMITGTGFQPGETVNNVIVQVAGPAPGSIYGPWTAQADTNGNFTTTWLVFSDDLLGTSLQLTSTGQSSGLSASTTFSDSISCPGLQTGTAPISPPAGGFDIDGDMVANTPTAGIGDWLPGSSGLGGVLSATGCPLNSLTTYHLIDSVNSPIDDNFSSGKADDNPNTWTWVFDPVGDKVDLKHALVHTARDANGHVWIVVAATRQSNNGDAYVDFEFLQNSLTVVTNAAGTGGTFSSAGPHGGRTINDFDLAITLTGGGTTPSLCVYRWNQVGVDSQGNPTYDYTNATAALPANAVFGAMNTSPVSIPNCYSNAVDTYAVNDFGEVAVDLTAMLSNFDPCATATIGTIFVKSKQSQSPSAKLGDFILPQPIIQPFILGPAAVAGANQAKCTQGAATSFNLAGSAQAGTFPLSSTNWSVVSGFATIDNPASLTPTVTLYGAGTNATLRLTVTDSGACANSTQHSDVVLTVNALPACSITGDDTTYDSSLGNTYSGPNGMATYSWTVSGNSRVTINGSAGAQSVKLDVASSASLNSSSFTLTLALVDSNGCASTCQKTVTLQSVGCLVQGPSVVCASSSGNQYSLSTQPTSATSYNWSISGNGSFDPAPVSSSTAVSVDAGTAGSYTVGVTITFNHGGTIACSMGVNVEQVTVSLISKSDVSCYQGNNGSLTVTASGGAEPYSYSLDGVTFQSSGAFAALTAGNYTVTAKDANGCLGTLPVSILQPSAPLTLNATPTAPLCSTDTGSISASASGGTGTITYSKDGINFQASGLFSGLAAGNYTITAKDANGCTATAPATITAPAAITLSATPSQPLCSTATGTINASASGGTGAFTYSKDGVNFQSAGSFTGLSAGTYTITAKDANGCTATATAAINAAPSAIILSANPTQPKCSTDTGSISASASGGRGTITYSIDATTFQPTGSFSGLAGGTYTVTAKDGNNCTATAPVTINSAPSAITLSATPTQPLCSTDSGSISASASGGTGTITYSKDGTHFQASNLFTGLAAGNYTITAKDANGCTATAPATITAPAAITVTATPSQPLCSTATGTINASASGGAGAFTYSKDGVTFQSSGSFSGLSAGTYTITAKDVNGCTATAPATINAAPSAIILSANATQPKCSTDTGSISASASGGTGTITYSIDGTTFQPTGSFSGLAGGTYTITAKDGNNCTATTLVTINSAPSAITLTATPTQPLCSTDTGSISASASGGTGTITYSKDGTHFQASNLFTGLAAGNYTITAKDANGCTATTTSTINTAPAAITLTATPTQPLCSTDTGSINASASGGSGTITYSKDGVNYQSSGSFSGLSAGLYTITAKDGNGCTTSMPVTIVAPSAIHLTLTPVQPKCSSDLGSIGASASGGTGSITYSQDGVNFQASGSFSGLSAGSYTITAKDANGCTAAASVIINSAPAPLALNTSTVQPKCSTDTGSITAVASGGTSAYSYSLNGTTFQSSGTFSGLQPNSYTVTAKDSHGCTTSQSATIIQPSAVSCSVSAVSDVQINTTGNTITATAGGGSPAYTFAWSCANSSWKITGCANNGQTSTLTYSAPGWNDSATFTVKTTDANGCTATCTLTVSCLPPSFVTDSMLCTFVSPFRLIFTQDPTNMPCYKLTASNPGQYYYNMTYQGSPGQQTATFAITLPYPFVTQGAQPIHAYDSVGINNSGGQTCLTPGNPIYVSSDQVTLASYEPNPVVGVTTYTFYETVPLSSLGYAYLNIHLDYGLKKCGGYAPGGSSGKDAVACSGSSVIPIPDLQADNLFYDFGYVVDGTVVNTYPGVQSANDFKKNPGTGGQVTKSTTLNPVSGATAVLKDSKGNILGSAQTDNDGWYSIGYKSTGKAATFYVILTPPGGAPQVQSISLKANGFMEADFVVP